VFVRKTVKSGEGASFLAPRHVKCARLVRKKKKGGKDGTSKNTTASLKQRNTGTWKKPGKKEGKKKLRGKKKGIRDRR